jgi:hypothetical protein
MAILARYDGLCLTCEEPYRVGQYVHWEKGVGCWHIDCPRPKNLKPLKPSVLDAPEFGQAKPRPFKEEE